MHPLQLALPAILFVTVGPSVPCASGQASAPDISTVAPDLILPPVEEGDPAPGKRVFFQLPGEGDPKTPMVLYLPVDWEPTGRYPVFCEYAGNGNYRNDYGDVSTGRPEGSRLGYGLTGGTGFIWVCLPFLNEAGTDLALTWWGDAPDHDPGATVAYAKRAVPLICEQFSGDPSRVVLGGFSRGAIACHAIGLHDDEIPALWRGFFCYSHFDGVREKWPFAGSDRVSARARLERLNGRPEFICQENSVAATREYLAGTGIAGDFTFAETGFRNHNDAWVLRPSPARDAAREWLRLVISE